MNSGQGPPQLPTLVVGQQIRSGPLNVTVTDAMVRQRERENVELNRHWREEQRRRHLAENQDEYFGEFKELKIRRRFIRRVFCILTLQLIFTSLVTATFINVEPAKKFMLDVDNNYLIIVAVAVFLLTYLSISCCEYARRTMPCNAINLIFLTLSLTYLTAYASASAEVYHAVLIATGATAAVTLVIASIATCSKFDLTGRLGFLLIISIVGLLGMLAMIIALSYLPDADKMTKKGIQIGLGAVGAFLMSIYLFFDLQTIMGGRKIELDPSEVVYATTQLYVDIIMLYKYILQIVDHAT